MTWMLTDWLAHPAGALRRRRRRPRRGGRSPRARTVRAWQPPTRGTVYGSLLNHLARRWPRSATPPTRRQYARARAGALHQARNTLVGHRAAVAVPADVPEVEVGATLGIVIGRTASRLREDDAPDWVADTRSSTQACPTRRCTGRRCASRCRDGFCPIGPWVAARRGARSGRARHHRRSTARRSAPPPAGASAWSPGCSPT